MTAYQTEQISIASDQDPIKLNNLEKVFGLKGRLSQPIINNYESLGYNDRLSDFYNKKYSSLIHKTSVENLKDHINFAHYKCIADENKNRRPFRRTTQSSEEMRHKPHFIYDPCGNLDSEEENDHKIDHLLRKLTMCKNITARYREMRTYYEIRRLISDVKRYHKYGNNYDEIIAKVGEEKLTQIDRIIERHMNPEPEAVDELGNGFVVEINLGARKIVRNVVRNNDNDSDSDIDNNDDSDSMSGNEIINGNEIIDDEIINGNEIFNDNENPLIENNEYIEQEIDADDAIKLYWETMTRVAWKNKDEGKCDLNTLQKVLRTLTPIQNATFEAAYVMLFKNIHTALQNIMHNMHYDENIIFNIIGHVCAVQNWYREVMVSPDLCLYLVDGELWQNFHNCMVELYPDVPESIREALE